MRDRRAEVASTVGPAIVTVVAGVIGAVASAGFVDTTPAAAEGEVAIEVMANGEQADSAPGPTVVSGAAVNLRYVITVGSSEPLYDFVVANLTGDNKPDCDTDGDGQPNGADGHPGPLSAGDSFICTARVVAGDAGVTYASVGRVTAYDFDITRTFVHENAAHYTTVRPTTTQPPTTQAPTTAAPTTATTTTSSTTSSTPSTTSASSTTSTSASSTTSTTSPSSASSSSSSSTTAAPATTATSTDVDAAAPGELASTNDPDGFPLWWVVLAFGVGGGIAVGVSSHLSSKNAAVPDP